MGSHLRDVFAVERLPVHLDEVELTAGVLLAQPEGVL
jgi:hypothetical protein